MRVFVAVVPPPAALDPVLAAVAPYRDLPASWVPRDRLHLTLVFLGEVADPLPYAGALAEAVAGVAPFEIALRGGGAFPRPARPKVLWAGVGGDVEALGRLARLARRTARAHRIDVERKPYVPHLTVARVRRDGFDATAPLAALGALDGPAWTVGEIVVMSSALGPVPEYRALRRCPLYQA